MIWIKGKSFGLSFVSYKLFLEKIGSLSIFDDFLGRRCNGIFQDCLVIGEAPFPYLWTSMALNMLQKRTLASCCVLNQGRTLWITGGEDGDFALNSTEFITLEENSVIGPELPFTIRF